ncbi:MAG: dienelactone hydrolase family protein [Thermoanaerobaculia bacterium]
MMIEEQVEIRTADGFLYRHEGGSRPGVIHLTDIGGIRSSQKAMASRLAAAGYTVLMPNLFYRFGKPPVVDFAAGFENEEVKKRVAELRAPLTPEALESDAGPTSTSSPDRRVCPRAEWVWWATASREA